MSISGIISITIILTAIFAYVNHKLIKWPPTIGIMVLSLSASILLATFGGSFLSEKAVKLISSIDFQDVLMNFMLSFLLFAGAIHINAHKLKKERLPVLALSTLGILISTALVGVMVWYLFSFFHFKVPFIYCLLFWFFNFANRSNCSVGYFEAGKNTVLLRTKDLWRIII